MMPLMSNEIAAATTDVAIERHTDDVWSALVDETGDWLGDGSTIEPAVGGAVRVNDVVSGTTRDGVVRESRTGELLEFDWWPTQSPDDASTVTIELTPIETGTRVIITETATRRLAASASAHANMQWRGAMFSAALSMARV